MRLCRRLFTLLMLKVAIFNPRPEFHIASTSLGRRPFKDEAYPSIMIPYNPQNTLNYRSRIAAT